MLLRIYQQILHNHQFKKVELLFSFYLFYFYETTQFLCSLRYKLGLKNFHLLDKLIYLQILNHDSNR
jgi:hypothetical protein